MPPTTLNSEEPVIAYIDAAIKLVFGVYLLFLSKPSKQI